ncbi:single-stranded DNA-binding protein [Clostridium culturomicium]|uniref:single-stranded DNA-binding protein n=1 Tax=Clostridium culturomicium TaxID=1499683 RepID=UPI00058B76A0|nr:single-stranded DNA-binding protein [Clostridium culturomicium]
MNKVVLIGRLTKDPELKFTPTGTSVTTFTLAVSRRYKKEGQPQADFIQIVAWGKTGEGVANYKKKGDLISVAGRIETRNYEAKDGTKRYVTEVIAEEIIFLDYENKQQGQAQQDNTIPGDYFGNGGMTEIEDDSDMPF